MKIIDTHTHLYFPQFTNLEQVVADCNAAGVTHQIQIGCDEISSLAALELARKFPHFYATVGLHPCDVDKIGIKNPDYHRYAGFENYDLQTKNVDQFFVWLESLLQDNEGKIVGVGETGFDRYHNDSAELFALQTECFRRHLDLAEKYDQTVVIHTRSARDETLDFLAKEMPGRNVQAVVHCFCEDAEFAEIVTKEYGFSLGIGGVATYSNAETVREAVAATPIEFLVTETDAPFLIPRKARNQGGKTNTPAYLPEVVKLIAKVKGLDSEACAEQLWENGKKLFNLH